MTGKSYVTETFQPHYHTINLALDWIDGLMDGLPLLDRPLIENSDLNEAENAEIRKNKNFRRNRNFFLRR